MRYMALLRKATKGIKPGDPVHQKLMTASKVSAAVKPSRSPYDAYFSLWHRIAGTIPAKQIDPLLAERGHALEPAVANWYQMRHPEVNVRDPHQSTPRTWLYEQDKRMAATPDRIIEQGGEVIALLEVKTANNGDEWGAEHTDEIPPHYYDQCQWQMMCIGADVVHVAALVNMSYREYTVHRNEAHIGMLYNAAFELLGSVEAGAQPDISEPGNMAVYEAVRELHPEIDPDGVVNLSLTTARDYLQALEDEARAKAEVTAAKTRLMDAMGDCKTAIYCGHTIATRTAKGMGKPYLLKSRKAPPAGALATVTLRNPFTTVKEAA